MSHVNQLIQQWYQSNIEYICIIVNVEKRKMEARLKHVAYDHIKGNHWASFTLDIFEKACFYSDFIRWPFPKNVITVTSKMFQVMSSLFK